MQGLATSSLWSNTNRLWYGMGRSTRFDPYANNQRRIFMKSWTWIYNLLRDSTLGGKSSSSSSPLFSALSTASNCFHWRISKLPSDLNYPSAGNKLIITHKKFQITHPKMCRSPQRTVPSIRSISSDSTAALVVNAHVLTVHRFIPGLHQSSCEPTFFKI